MSYVATRSGLTRVRVYDLSVRIKKLADLFIQRHNKALDEAWYSRTVDWNMRFGEESTIITVPYNAYIRLIAKLRQRITQRHPAINDTRANCDPQLDGSEPAAGLDLAETEPSATSSASANSASSSSGGASSSESVQNDEPATSAGPFQEAAGGQSQLPEQGRINYNDYSSYDFLDLLTNSSVHVSATQSVIVGGAGKQRSPVGVTGLLYDYATFARRFLNTTSLNIVVKDDEENADRDSSSGGGEGSDGERRLKIDICPNGQCPVKCGFRNDSIDCLLVDNNGFIVVGEELPYVGRSLSVYDEKLMLSLVNKRLFHQINLTDYQAICARSAEQVAADQRAAAQAVAQATAGGQPSGNQLQQLSQISSSSISSPSISAPLISGLLANAAASLAHLAYTLGSLLALKGSLIDLERLWLARGPGEESTMEPLFQEQYLISAQSAVSNQSLLALLPNKTYLRPCERLVQLYETRPLDSEKLVQDSPEYYETRCNCSAWFVYKAVPRTNLIMLIVNTTSACRRCEQPSAAPAAAPQLIPTTIAQAPPPPSNYIPIEVGPGSAAAPTTAAVGNKTAEDQVCAMLERDAQLYIMRSTPESCYAYNQEEAQIHLCGGSRGLEAPIGLIIMATTLLLLLLAPLQAPQQQQQQPPLLVPELAGRRLAYIR